MMGQFDTILRVVYCSDPRGRNRIRYSCVDRIFLGQIRAGSALSLRETAAQSTPKTDQAQQRNVENKLLPVWIFQADTVLIHITTPASTMTPKRQQ